MDPIQNHTTGGRDRSIRSEAGQAPPPVGNKIFRANPDPRGDGSSVAIMTDVALNGVQAAIDHLVDREHEVFLHGENSTREHEAKLLRSTPGAVAVSGVRIDGTKKFTPEEVRRAFGLPPPRRSAILRREISYILDVASALNGLARKERGA